MEENTNDNALYVACITHNISYETINKLLISPRIHHYLSYVNTPDSYTPLMAAIINNRINIAMKIIPLSSPKIINRVNNNGETALKIASELRFRCSPRVYTEIDNLIVALISKKNTDIDCGLLCDCCDYQCHR